MWLFIAEHHIYAFLTGSLHSADTHCFSAQHTNRKTSSVSILLFRLVWVILCIHCCLLLCSTGRAVMQQGWGTLTEERKQEEERVVWSQRIVYPPPPRPYKSTFKHSTSTQRALLLKALQKYTALLNFITPGPGIRGKNETVEVWAEAAFASNIPR